jgi:hypothetical protein
MIPLFFCKVYEDGSWYNAKTKKDCGKRTDDSSRKRSCNQSQISTSALNLELLYMIQYTSYNTP